MDVKQWHVTHVGNKLIGNFNDPQVLNSYAKYGDRLMETLLVKTIDINAEENRTKISSYLFLHKTL